MIKLSDQKDNSSSNTGAVVLEKEPEVKEPPLYQVVLLMISRNLRHFYKLLVHFHLSERNEGNVSLL